MSKKGEVYENANHKKRRKKSLPTVTGIWNGTYLKWNKTKICKYNKNKKSQKESCYGLTGNEEMALRQITNALFRPWLSGHQTPVYQIAFSLAFLYNIFSLTIS